MTLLNEQIFNLANTVYEVAQKNPDRIAVIEPDGYGDNGRRQYKKYTYAQLSAEVESVAIGLREMGIVERTKIICMTPPGYESCVVGLALQRVGAFTLWIDPSVGYLNVAERLNRIQPEAFVGVPFAHLGRMVFGWGPRFVKKAIVVNGCFPGAHTLKSLRRAAPKIPAQPKVSPEDPAAVLYTTGSTGPAKPTLYLHKNYLQLYKVAQKSWRFDMDVEPPVDMAIFPAFFFIPLSAGGTVVVPPINFARETPAKADARSLLEVINDCGVKTCFGSPVLLENMAQYAIRHQIKTPSLKRVIGGGAPIYASVKKSLLEMMGPDGQVASNYGATEALPSTEMDGREALQETFPLSNDGAGVCVGRPFEGVEIRIIKMSDDIIPSIQQAEELPDGEIGEIIVRGAHISPGYYLEPLSNKKNKIADPEGQWHRLGDAGYKDEKQRLWVCGRVSQRVRAKEGPLFSLLAEPIFDRHPDVERSGLVGVMRDSVEVPVICIQLKSERNQSQEEIKKSLLTWAQNYKATQMIKDVLFIDKLPVDPRHNSKIERPLLARWAAKRLCM